MKNNGERMGHFMNPERNNPAVYEYRWSYKEIFNAWLGTTDYSYQDSSRIDL